jgi:hypothetical protein
VAQGVGPEFKPQYHKKKKKLKRKRNIGSEDWIGNKIKTLSFT